MGQLCRFEMLAAGNHQKIESGTLPGTQQQIFTDGGFQGSVDVGADLHGHGGSVVDTLVAHSQTVQEVIGADLFFQAAGAVGRPALKQGHSVFLFSWYWEQYTAQFLFGQQKNAPFGTEKHPYKSEMTLDYSFLSDSRNFFV
jgi:hypothetical protein